MTPAAAAAARPAVRAPGAAPATSSAAAEASLLLDAGEVAQLLGMGRSTFFRMDSQGLVPEGVRIGPKMRRWSRVELARWIEAGCPPRHQWETLQR